MPDTPRAPASPLPPVASFPALVRWLADSYHEGVLFRVAHHLGRHPSLIDQWAKGLKRHPGIGSLQAISHGYGLPMAWLIQLVYGTDVGGTERVTSVSPQAPPTRPRPRKVTPISGGSDNGDYCPVVELPAKPAKRRGIMSTWPLRLAA